MSKKMRWVYIALVGTICFLVQWGTVHVLRQFIHPIVADVIAFVLSAQFNFVLSKAIVYRDRHKESDRTGFSTWVLFNVVVVLTTTVNATVFWSASGQLGEFGALVIAAGASMVCAFVLNYQFVFKGEGHMLLAEYHDIDLSKAAKDGIAFFLPAYKEAKNLPYVVGEAVSYLHGLGVPFNVIVVNDGSPDNTEDIVHKLIAMYPEVQLITHEQNQGYGAALRTGFKAALQTGYEWIGFCDSDGQFKPHDLSKLIGHAVYADADICIGYRIERADNLKRRLMGRGWHIVSRLILGYTAIDVDCGFKVFRRHAVVALDPKLIGDYATISPEILARAHRSGNKIVQVGVKHYPRIHGEQTGSNLAVVIESFKGLATVRRTLKREELVKG